VNTELSETARQVFADHPAEIADGWPAKLWSTLDELGLVRLGLTEDAGGSGGELTDVAALLLAAGEATAPVPLAETELAGWLLHEAGLTVPMGPLAVAIAEGGVRVSDGSVSGSLTRVGWARHATRIAVLVAGDGSGADVVLSVDPAHCELEPGTNLAGEPRDGVVLGGAVESAAAPAGTRELLARRAALLRALLLAGACGRAVAQSVRYVGERVQFGRPIAKFQAVQQQLALAAAESAAARAAAEAGVRIAGTGGFDGAHAGLAVASAKARSSQAAGTVARVAHQVHGAIGFTLEHELRLSTTRLWAWREEDGSDAHWNALVGQQVLAEGADGLWPLLTR
jgi:acyl-CoA dehydrogenase